MMTDGPLPPALADRARKLRTRGRLIKLVDRRRQRGLEQSDAARQLGVTLTTYQTWEAGLCPRTHIRIVGFAINWLESSLRSARPSRDEENDAKGQGRAQARSDKPGAAR